MLAIYEGNFLTSCQVSKRRFIGTISELEDRSLLEEGDLPDQLAFTFFDDTPVGPLQRALKRVKLLFEGQLQLMLDHAQKNHLNCDDIVQELEGARYVR